jgi:hypothetical protein
VSIPAGADAVTKAAAARDALAASRVRSLHFACLCYDALHAKGACVAARRLVAYISGFLRCIAERYDPQFSVLETPPPVPPPVWTGTAWAPPPKLAPPRPDEDELQWSPAPEPPYDPTQHTTTWDAVYCQGCGALMTRGPDHSLGYPALWSLLLRDPGCLFWVPDPATGAWAVVADVEDAARGLSIRFDEVHPLLPDVVNAADPQVFLVSCFSDWK